MPRAHKPSIRVVTALVERGGRYLVAQRRPQAALPLLWEFPGGRVEPGETDAQALCRELMKRLALEVEVEERVMRVNHAYERYTIELRVYRCRVLGAEPHPVYANAVRWASAEELEQLPFPGADQATIDALLEDL